MHPVIEQLTAHGVVITDGAWGTELQRRGLGLGEIPDVWNLTHPDRVESVARAYVEAGSRVILTNTFGANRFRLEQESEWQKQVSVINRRGVEISKEAAQGRALVFASMGPSGKLLLAGDVTAGDLEHAFSEQAQALALGGADAVIIETMSDLEEARLALRAARATGLPVVACMVYDSGRDQDRTMMGTTPEQAARALTEAGADVVGANCGQGIQGFATLCRRLHEATPAPIWIKANAGLPDMAEGRVVYHATPEGFAGHLPALIEAGASFVGGCCGTHPGFIQALDQERIRCV